VGDATPAARRFGVLVGNAHPTTPVNACHKPNQHHYKGKGQNKKGQIQSYAFGFTIGAK
jgi:hypothetical protein